MVRWLRWGAAGALVVWLLAMAWRERRRQGRRGLALPLAAGSALAFLFAISSLNPQVSKVLMGAALALLAGSIAMALWQGFRR